MSSETTNARYKRALEEIAAGVDDPRAVAVEALRSRARIAKAKPPNPNYKSMEQRYTERVSEGLRFFEAWYDAGQPALTVYGRSIGMHPSSVSRRLDNGLRALTHPSRKGHRLHKAAVRLKWPAHPSLNDEEDKDG